MDVMTEAFRPNTATAVSAVSMEGNQAVNGVIKDRNAVDLRVTKVSSHTPADKPSVDSRANHSTIDIGPAYAVEISPEGMALSQNKDAQIDNTAKNQPSVAEKNNKTLKEWHIQREVARLQQVEQSIRSHEQAHKSAGGGFAGGASFIYARGPDGRMYVSGGEVSIQAPEGKTPEETIQNMEIVRRAALAPPDPSGQDLSVAAAAAQIESKALAAIRQGHYLKQTDMKNAEAYAVQTLTVMPTSMEGLIATLMPPGGMLG